MLSRKIELQNVECASVSLSCLLFIQDALRNDFVTNYPGLPSVDEAK
jgi:hypothetical protein